METRCSTGALLMDDVPQLLLELACEAKRHPPGSPNRQRALNELVNKVLQSNLLGHPQKGLWPPDVYAYLYHEAIQKTCLCICQQIDRYNPEHPVMAWVNFTLKNRLIETVREFNNGKVCILSLDELDKQASVEETTSDADLLRQFLEEDPENLFKSEHIKGHPKATFQVLVIAKFVEDKTWEQISQEWGISLATISSFVTRRLQKFKAYFQKYLQE